MKKKIKISILIFIVALLLCSVGLIYMNGNQKEEVRHGEVSGFIDKWYIENKVISHALGGVDGKTYTNSIDALDYNYRRGKRVFEADFNYTADGVIILSHDFQETKDNLIDYPDGYIPTYDEFMSNRIYYKFHPTSAEQLLDYMQKHGEMYLVSDIKYDNQETITNVLNGIVSLAKEKGQMEVLDRFIIQFYYEQNYYDIKNIYPFKNYIYSLYAERIKDYESVKNFCVMNNIPVVLLKASHIKDNTIPTFFNDNNIKVYVYTVNNLTRAFEKVEFGVYGFVSDYMLEKDLLIKKYFELQNKFNLPIDLDFNKLYDN